jgi:xanthine dehydrogenase accessory factor
MRREILNSLVAARSAGQTAILATRLPGGEQALILPGQDGGGELGDLPIDDSMRAEALQLLAQDSSRTIDAACGRVFLHVFNPPPRLIIVGAVHIAEPLARMAGSAGYSVVLIDPRRAFATREQFRGFKMIDDWPDEALQRLKLDPQTAVVTLTHDPKLDDAALRVALSSNAFYIGCLGSRKTHTARLHRLRTAGCLEEDLARIHGPVGLPIGARTPAEIAVAILAEITQVRRGDQ